MKPRLTVLLGAGSTVLLDRDKPHLRGMPSTEELTACLARMQFPQVILRGTAFTLASQDNAFVANGSTPISQLLFRALSGTFATVNFELILQATEQLLALTGMKAGAKSSDERHPAIAAFVEPLRRYEILDDWSLLRATREAIICAIHDEIRNRAFALPKGLPLHQLFAALASEFRLAVFTLNYDDVIDEACAKWFDGFADAKESSTAGAYWESRNFDAAAFDLWRDSSDPVLVHMHGSVRFGPSRNSFNLVKYSSTQAASDAIKAVSGGDKSTGGQIVTPGPIISGLNKAARLTLNPVPYGYYYRALINSLLASERLLVIGYGAMDEHVNTWLEQYCAKHEEKRRVGWVGLLKGDMVGEPTHEKDMIRLLSGNKFEDFRHNADRDSPTELMDCGDMLRLGVGGFPLHQGAQSTLISFLVNQ